MQTNTNASLRDEILKLKEQRRAVIIAHNYQREEVQDLADFTGDSLELSRTAQAVDCDVIVFCGVNFMAESASILSPEKTVLLPRIDAVCPMADMVRPSSPRTLLKTFPGYVTQPTLLYPMEYSLADIRKDYPGAPIVAYVNTSAEVKAASDICCTSANVIKVIESLEADTIICVPDKNLSQWAARNTDKKIIAWDGFCHVHDRVTRMDAQNAKQQHPKALFMAHPECRPEVLDEADHVTSTSGMLRYATASSAKEFIVGTEVALMYRLGKENPEKVFHPLRGDMVCPNMKKTSLSSIRDALTNLQPIVKVPEEIRVPAKEALDKMLAV